MLCEYLFFPFHRFLFAETVFGVLQCRTQLSEQLHATAFLVNYAPKEEEFARNSLQASGIKRDSRPLH